MKHLLTSFLVFALVLVGIPKVNGQDGPPFGDDFIFFVNGINTEIPQYDTRINVIDDPSDPTNKILEYPHGNFQFYTFSFSEDPNVGVNMTQNQMDRDVLHARIWVDPENAGKGRLHFMFEDKTDGSGANDGSADLPFRLVWQIPDSMRNGEWHEISVPFPPPTYSELEDAKTAGELDGLDSLWVYAGAWSSGGFGVGIEDRKGPNTTDNPDLWEEFEWTNVQNVGIQFDNDQGGGPIYLDDVYIGIEGLDLSDQNATADPATGVTAVATADSNTISWATVTNAGGYKVYYSIEEFMTISDPGVALLSSLDSDVISVGHQIEIPHESLAPITLHYAVTTVSSSGVENEDISMSMASVANENLPFQSHIPELSEDQLNHLDDLLFDDSFKDIENGFPEDYMPFELNMAHFKSGDGGLPDSDKDLSGKLWAGYRADPPELYLYVEVTDDQISLQASGGNPGEGWQHDSIEFGWGNYDVREVAGGGIFSGSPHTDIQRGDFADYQFRLGGQGDGTKAGTDSYAFVGWSIDAVPQGAGTIYDQLIDDNSQMIGYKILSVIPLDQIQNVDAADAITLLPTGNEVGYFPFNFVLNDGDGANRDAQIQWSIKANADGQWWNTPAQWPPVALVGMGAQEMIAMPGIGFSAMADGSEITDLSVAEADSQTYYVKLNSQPSANVMVAITGQDGSDLTLDDDGDASTSFTGLTFTMDDWNTAQAVMIMAAIDGDGDDDSVTLTHTATSNDAGYNGLTQTIMVTVTDVTQTSVDGEELPKEITLEQNYPNPFNPTTVIEFALPASETVTLRVFDSMGRTVATLLDQKLHTAGTHTVQFNASGLASGVYLYRLEAESSVLMTRTMLLVK